MTTISSFGIVGNIMSIIVLTRRHSAFVRCGGGRTAQSEGLTAGRSLCVQKSPLISVLLKRDFFFKMRAFYLQPSSLQYSSFFKEGGSKSGSSHFNEKYSFVPLYVVLRKKHDKNPSRADTKMQFHRKLSHSNISFFNISEATYFIPVKNYPSEIFTRATPFSCLV